MKSALEPTMTCLGCGVPCSLSGKKHSSGQVQTITEPFGQRQDHTHIDSSRGLLTFSSIESLTRRDDPVSNSAAAIEALHGLALDRAIAVPRDPPVSKSATAVELSTRQSLQECATKVYTGGEWVAQAFCPSGAAPRVFSFARVLLLRLSLL